MPKYLRNVFNTNMFIVLFLRTEAFFLLEPAVASSLTSNGTSSILLNFFSALGDEASFCAGERIGDPY